MEPVSLVGIQSARARIESSIHVSPCQFSHHLSELTRLPIHLKLENLQRTGSFKNAAPSTSCSPSAKPSASAESSPPAPAIMPRA